MGGAYDFTDVIRPAPDQAASAPGGTYDFTDVYAPPQPQQPQKTGQQKAQDIAKTAGFNPGPEFGSTVVDRLAADFGKGVATSLPGRLVGNLTGQGNTVSALAGLPASQPIPYFPDADTIGQMVGDSAMFSLVAPPLAYAGRAAGEALAARAPLLTNILSKGSLAHVELAQSMAGELAQANMDLFRALGTTVSVGAGFGGLEKAAGSDNATAATQGFLAGVSLSLAPAFRALKTVAHFEKLASPRYIAAEQNLAKFLDTQMTKLVVGVEGAAPLPPRAAAEQVGTMMSDLLDPQFGRQVKDMATVVYDQYQSGKTIANSLKDVRELVPEWERVVSSTRQGWVQNKFEKYGLKALGNAYQGLTTSIESSLRKQGFEGTAIANGVRKAYQVSDQSFADLWTPVKKVLDNVDDDALAAWAHARELGTRSDIPDVFTPLDEFLDKHAFDRLSAAGTPIQSSIERGRYLPHMADFQALQDAVRDPKIAPKLAQALGLNEDALIRAGQEALDLLDEARSAPVLKVMRSSLDLQRTLPLTYQQIKEIGLPYADIRVALSRYARQVADKAAFSESFGANGERLNSLIEAIQRKHPAQVAKFYADSIRKVIGLDSEVGDVSQAIGFFQNNLLVPTHLGLAQISNAGQNLNTITDVGAKHFTRAALTARRAVKEAVAGGTAEDVFIQKVQALIGEIQGDMGDFLTGVSGADSALLPATAQRTGLGRLNLGRWFLKKSGFNTLENWNRLVAARAGKSWIEDMVEQGANGALSAKNMTRVGAEFSKLGLDFEQIVARGAATDGELFRGAVEISNRTQFRIRPFDLPKYWSSPNAAIFRMLKTFAFNQSKFIAQRVAKPAAEFVASGGQYGSVRPLGFFLAGYPAAGYAIGSIRSGLKGEIPFEGDSPLGAYTASLGWVGGLGVADDMFNALEQGSRGIAKFMAGPSLSYGFDAIDASVSSVKRQNLKPLGRFIIGNNIPLVSQNLFGSKNAMFKALDLEN